MFIVKHLLSKVSCTRVERALLTERQTSSLDRIILDESFLLLYTRRYVPSVRCRSCAVLGPIQMAKYDSALLTPYDGLDVLSVDIIVRDDYCLTLGHTIYYDTTELTLEHSKMEMQAGDILFPVCRPR
jgi:hypothetical protein